MTMNELNNVNEDSKIAYFDRVITVELDNEEDNILKFRYFTLKKEIKRRILWKIYDALARGFASPLSILLPHKMVRTAPKNMPYPIPFLDHKIYIIPHVEEIMVLENE